MGRKEGEIGMRIGRRGKEGMEEVKGGGYVEGSGVIGVCREWGEWSVNHEASLRLK